ncbi:hypothetical protein [Pontibacter pamirensis]|uniref:hypothetical protein n=1 Tax=Pontibacter pamirensis TaxID=2562824 RepID=UPI00138A2820|nr:hypothetical protein [Pontibacter pamirensis]
MKKIVSLSIIMSLSLVFLSCKKEEVIPVLDKEVRLVFFSGHWSTNQTDFELLPDFTHLIKFDKTNYSNLSSITIYASIATGSLDNTVEMELFNVTDSVSVNNTSLQASTTVTTVINYKLVFSDNILNELPEKEIDLAIRLKSKNGSYVYVTTPFLLLKRD